MMTFRSLITGILVAAALAGCAGEKAPSDETSRTPENTPPAASGDARVVEMTVDGQGFHPDRIPARAGEPLTLAITRTTDETCGTEILVPALGVDRKLPLNEKVEITVTPTEKGEIAFACGMDMLKGTIVVD